MRNIQPASPSNPTATDTSAGERDEAAAGTLTTSGSDRARAGLSGGRADGAGGHDHSDGVATVVSIHGRVVEHRRAVSVAVPELQGAVAHEAHAPRLLVARPGPAPAR